MASALLLLAGCHGTPTAPQGPALQACGTAVVFEEESFYRERSEPEREFRGTLEFRDVPSTPNGRDHRYFLNGVPVYSGGTSVEPAFRSAAGTAVTIRGKLVDFTHGAEIWTAALTSCR